MNLKDINEKYLNVGYRKREAEGTVTPNLKRHVMGRKGIGKLSLFSIAHRVEVHSVKNGQKNGFLITTEQIKKQIEENNGVYHPDDINSSQIKISKGTKIILTDLKKRVSATFTEIPLRRRLARRFNIIGKSVGKDKKDRFQVKVNGKEVTVKDRDYFESIQFLWHIGEEGEEVIRECKNLKEHLGFDGIVDNKQGYSVSGWIGAVEKPSQLDKGNNSIAAMAWGKLVHEDMLAEYEEGGLYSKYLIGEINANFLDDDKLEDIATSNRQKVIEDDPRYLILKSYVHDLLKKIQSVWSEWRKKHAKEKALKNPAIKKWYESLPDSSRPQAEKLFDKLESLPMQTEDDRKELYKYAVLAFERLRIREGLNELEKLTSVDDLRFASVFNVLSDIEAVLYHDIASERVKVINVFAGIIDKNKKEEVIQHEFVQ
jgi:hypothetical protein